MVRDAGASEVHMRIASPPTTHSCFYGIDTPERDELLAAHTQPARRWRSSSASTRWPSSRSTASTAPWARPAATRLRPQYCDACFTGDYPIRLTDHDGRPGDGQLSLLEE